MGLSSNEQWIDWHRKICRADPPLGSARRGPVHLDQALNQSRPE